MRVVEKKRNVIVCLGRKRKNKNKNFQSLQDSDERENETSSLFWKLERSGMSKWTKSL